MDSQKLREFIVRAKMATYVGDGKPSLSYRPAAHDLQFHEAPYSYLDSYFGGTDFLGQEVVYKEGQPLWAMNYYGYILHPVFISPAQAGQVIKASLSALYKEGRFLGGFTYTFGEFHYTDTSTGTHEHFTGKEWITYQETVVYELVYHGGLVKA